MFASVMATLGLQILFESIRAIITKVMVVIFFLTSLINNLTVTASIFVEHSYVFHYFMGTVAARHGHPAGKMDDWDHGFRHSSKIPANGLLQKIQQ